MIIYKPIRVEADDKLFLIVFQYMLAIKAVIKALVFLCFSRSMFRQQLINSFAYFGSAYGISLLI